MFARHLLCLMSQVSSYHRICQVMPTLTQQLDAQLADRQRLGIGTAPRCLNCDVTKKIDLTTPPRKGWVRSVCRRCGVFLGDRPVGKHAEV